LSECRTIGPQKRSKTLECKRYGFVALSLRILFGSVHLQIGESLGNRLRPRPGFHESLGQYHSLASPVKETGAIPAIAVRVIIAAGQRLLLSLELAGHAGRREQPSPRVVGSGLRSLRRPIANNVRSAQQVRPTVGYPFGLESVGVSRARHIAQRRR